jgi:hypothetical protein
MRDEALQPRVMRSAPVDTSAIATLLERAKPSIGAWRHEPLDVLSRHGGKKTIARQATAERTERSFQL